MPAPSFTAETTHGTIRLEDFKTAEAAEERMQASYECTDWFFCVGPTEVGRRTRCLA
jgi:hypothetical protein